MAPRKPIPVDRLRPYIVPALIGLTAIALVLFPIADCIDCDVLRPWGRNDAAFAIRSEIFDIWLLGASFLVGLFRLRHGWVLPLAFVAINCLTEPLGGVAWWSLIQNEGPLILLIGGLAGLLSFAIGRLFGLALVRIRSSLRPLELPTAKPK